MIISYAQNFEDVMLWRALGHIENGFYIDIGAQDPVTDSVSLAFYEKGWRGVHVEATPHYAELLRRARPDELVLQAVVSNRHGLATFYEIPDTGISTGDPALVASHREKGFTVNVINVPCLTLADIFRKANGKEIQWLKIDVEGMEQQLLEGWGRSKIRPWVVVVESTLPLTQIESYEKWESIILKKGYGFAYFDGLNRFYVSTNHAELLQSFSTPPNVFDGFTFNGGASNPFCSKLQNEYLSKEKELRQDVVSTRKAFEEHRKKLQIVTGELHGIRSEYEKTTQQLVEQERSAQEKLEALRSDLNAKSAQDARQSAARERALLERIETLQGETQRIEREQAERERAFASLVSQVQDTAHQYISDHLMQFAEKERSAQEALEHLRIELDAKSAQAAEQSAAREQALLERIESLHGEMRRLEQEQAGRERALIADAAALREAIHLRSEEHLKQLAEHECNAHARLGALRSELNAASAQAAGQSAFRERQLAVRIETLAREMRNMEQEQAEQVRVLQKTFEQQKADEALYFQNQQHVLQLRESLEQTQNELQHICSSFSWKLTAPLRWVTTRRVVKPGKTNESPNTYPLPAVSTNLPDEALQPLDDFPVENVTQLLALHDQPFIHAAYRILLGREPDPGGQAYYLGRLRSGIPKIQLLWQLRVSSEAREHKACLPGLDVAIKCYKRCRLPIMGWLFRCIYLICRFQIKTLSSARLRLLNPRRLDSILDLESVLDGNTGRERKLRRIENQVFLLMGGSNHRFDQMAAALAELHDLVLQQAQNIPATTGGIPQNHADIHPIHLPESCGLSQLSRSAREIYFQIKDAAVNRAQAARGA